MTAPVPTQRYPWHAGDEQSRDAALRAHYGRLPGRRPRRRLIGPVWALLASCAWWTVFVFVPIWWALSHGRLG